MSMQDGVWLRGIPRLQANCRSRSEDARKRRVAYHAACYPISDLMTAAFGYRQCYSPTAVPDPPISSATSFLLGPIAIEAPAALTDDDLQ